MRKNKKSSTKAKMLFSEVLFKCSLSFFCMILFLACFWAFDGLKILQNTTLVNNFSKYDFQVHVIDVENGDAMILRLPENKVMLIDCGSEIYQDRVVSYVQQFLKQEQLHQIDYFLTLRNKAHFGDISS